MDAYLCRILVVSMLCVSLIGCASTHIANVPETGDFQTDEDEQRLWKRAAELQDILANSGFTVLDHTLTDYVNRVLEKVTSSYSQENGPKHLRAYILKDPYLNAFCLPDGAIYIHTSILAHCENEAQLATVLAHESAHFFHRHALRQVRSVTNKTAFLSVLQVFSAGAGVVFGGPSVSLARIIGEYAVVGSFYGYSREIEREADATAFDLIAKAGYDPREARAFMNILYAATKDDTETVPYFYSTHPRTKTRIVLYEELIAAYARRQGISPEQITGALNAEDYRAHTKTILLDNAELDIKRNKPALARGSIERFQTWHAETSRSAYLLGKTYLTDQTAERNTKTTKKKTITDEEIPDEETNAIKAEKAFLRALELDDTNADSHQALGMFYYKNGDIAHAREHFKKYLAHKPDACDADYIREYINE